MANDNSPRYTSERTALLLVDPYNDFLSEEESSGPTCATSLHFVVRWCVERLFKSQDAREGISAYNARRPPAFTGK